MTAAITKRLAALEAGRRIATVAKPPTDAEVNEAAQLFEEGLRNPPPPDPRAVAYWARSDLVTLSADYDAMLKGASAPWE